VRGSAPPGYQPIRFAFAEGGWSRRCGGMRLPHLLLLGASFGLSSLRGGAASAPEVKLARGDDRVRVEIGGQLLTEYIFKGAYRPYCYPILAADGTPLTRGFPMTQVAGEDPDHPHHRSLWFAHSDVNGVDFWNQDDGGSRRPKPPIRRTTMPCGSRQPQMRPLVVRVSQKR